LEEKLPLYHITGAFIILEGVPQVYSGVDEVIRVHQSTERVILDHLSEDPVIAHVDNRAVVHVCDLHEILKCEHF
jgi:hypothetical protein